MATTPEVSQEMGVRDLLEAGLHFGHQTKRWNPKMKRYIFDKRNGIHIIDLSKSLVMLQNAMDFLYETVANGRSILFVGTKKQAQQVIKDAAEKSGQHYVTHRWLGGTLTNSSTIRRSVKRMREIEELDKSGKLATMHKQEASRLRREHEKLNRNLGGIADMYDHPGAMIVIDVNREAIAVKEANRLNIPVVAIVDTNCDPDPIDYVIPGNDDAIRAIKLISAAVADTANKAKEEYAKIAAEAERKRAEESARQAEAAKKAKEAVEKKAAEAKAAAGDKPRKKAAPAKKKAANKAEETPGPETKAEDKQEAAPAAEQKAAEAAPEAEAKTEEAPEAPAAEQPAEEAPVAEEPKTEEG